MLLFFNPGKLLSLSKYTVVPPYPVWLSWFQLSTASVVLKQMTPDVLSQSQ